MEKSHIVTYNQEISFAENSPLLHCVSLEMTTFWSSIQKNLIYIGSHYKLPIIIRVSSHPFGMTNTLSVFIVKAVLTRREDTVQRGVSVIKGCCL